MAINTKHPEYLHIKKTYKKCIDFYNGEDEIKNAGETYTPKLTGQTQTQFKRYVSRGMLNPALKKTIKLLVGMLLHKQPKIEVPEKIKYILEDATGSGLGINKFIESIAEEVLLTGRYGVLVDYGFDKNDKPRAFLIGSKGLDIHNWASMHGELTNLVLDASMYMQKGDDPYELELKEKLKEIVFLTDTKTDYTAPYIVTHVKTNNGFEVEKSMPLLIKGESFGSIPFTFVSVFGNEENPETPPLLDLVNIIAAHWKNSVDLEHGLHWVALPTPWVAGMQMAQVQKPTADGTTQEAPTLSIGSENAWALSADAKVGMLEFSGAGLDAIQKAIDKKENLIAVIGASWLASQKNGVETAEALRINKAGDSATLSTIATTLEGALKNIFLDVAKWEGIENPEINIEFNKKFVDSNLDAQTISALLNSFTQGAMSLDSFIFNMKGSNFIPENISIDDERDKINLNNPDENGI